MVSNFISIFKTVIGCVIYPLLLCVVSLTVWGINPHLLSLRSDNSLLPFIIIFVLSVIGGEVAALIKLPKIVGMIISGFALSNTTDGILKFNVMYSDVIRNIALTILLIQAGIELDLGVLKRMSGIVLRLCFIPMIAEIGITTITGHFILNLPIVWSVMLGLILSAACAAIVVPNMIDLKRKCLGVDKGIPSLVTAACSLDDVFAIAGFGITLGFAFPTQDNASLTWKILKAPTEVAIGVLLGTAFGLIFSHLPEPESDRLLGIESLNNSSEQEFEDKISRNNLIRLISLTFGGFAFIFCSTQLDLAGSGPLGVLILAAVAGYKFRKFPHVNNDVVKHLDRLWSFMAIFLFSLIGADVKITNIDSNIVLSIIAVLLIGICFRILITFGCLFSGGLNFKERAFISIAWISKAAVQAAVGPVALTIARSRCKSDCDQDEDVIWSKVILTTSVFAVLICAPLGALGIAFTAPKLLSVSELTISSCPAINPTGHLDKLKHVALTIASEVEDEVIRESRRSI